jgi:hypothetical protein
MTEQPKREVPKFLGSDPSYTDELLGRGLQLARFKTLLTATMNRPILLGIKFQ